MKQEDKDFFPELKESRDDRIKTAILKYLKKMCGNSQDDVCGVHVEDAISWIEKQCERLENYDKAEKEKSDFVGDGFVQCHADFLDFKEGNTYWLEYIGDDKYNVRSDNLLGRTYHITPCQLYTVFKKLTWIEKQGKQKAIDELGTKFKLEKGKWYVCIKDLLLDNYANKAFRKGDTYLSTQDGSLIPSNSNVPFEVVCPSTYFRDWTIEDAKDGDVIFYDDGWTCIFKYIHGIWYSSYCFITDDGEFHTGYERHAVDSTINGNAHPATKEQRDLLLQKIKEAGYEWDADKKELRREEVK